jgi:two-component system NtrC family sensor kinase
VILLLIRDLSERNRLENQLIQSSKLASLGELAAGIAHEIGNPLSAISNYTQFLSLAEGMEVEDRESLEGIKVEVSRIDGIIKNLLAFSRSSSEEITEVDINEVINNSLSLISHQRLFRNIKLKKILAADYLQIKADRNQLVQVIVNILLNSAQAMPDGGIIQIQSNCVNGRLEIKITDTGIGIPKKNLDKIFNPFFTTKPDGVGTGLGLSIVYRIIEKFDGLVEVESPATEKLAKDVTGTTFTITFPVLPRGGEI